MSWNIALFAIVSLISSLANVQCINNWKPVSGPPTSFSIRQTHPSIGASSSSFRTTNALLDAGTGDELINFQATSSGLDHSSNTGLDDEAFGGGYENIKSKLFSSANFPEDTCSVDKYAFDYEGTVQYKHRMPKMDQFALCVWMRFTNHSGDHSLFTYSVDDEPREIQFWVANSKGSSFISMAVHGQSLYRLNYPLKMRVWHHACSSWNGKTGEWQLWMRSERVGRGFHNRLVGHEIDGNGLAFSGGPSITGKTAENLHFELTLLQIYKVALSAGKAHRDHKHHHVHQFGHDGPISTSPPPPPQPAPTQSPNPLLANGQINSRVKINLAGIQNQPPAPPSVPSQIVGGSFAQANSPLLSTNFVNGQFNTADRFLSEQLSTSYVSAGSARTSQQAPVTFPDNPPQPTTSSPFVSLSPNLSPAPAIRFIDFDGSTPRYLFKRAAESKTTLDKSKEDKKVNKRGLVMLEDGSIVDDSLLTGSYEFDGLAQFGLPAFKDDLQKRMNIEDEIKEHDKEPAEDEVKAVMEVCTSCDVEPFKGAVALTWKNLRVSLDGALKGRSVGGCGYF